jgi:hypothetical protein
VQPGGDAGLTQLTNSSLSTFMADPKLGGDDAAGFTRSTKAEGRAVWIIDSTNPDGPRLLQVRNPPPGPARLGLQAMQSAWAWPGRWLRTTRKARR